jgi:hypothetical protein
MKKIHNFIFLFLISFTLIFSGWGEISDCSLKNTDYKKYTYNEDTEVCTLTTKIKANVCGNGIVESGETFCNCEKDVEMKNPLYGCFGNVGEFASKQCEISTNKCELKQNKDKISKEIKEILLKNSYLKFNFKFEILKPFVINSFDNNKIKIEVELFDFRNGNTLKAENIIFETLKLKDSYGIVLGEIAINSNFNKLSQKVSKEIILNELAKSTQTTKIKLEAVISYSKNTYNKEGKLVKSQKLKEILKGTLGKYTLIDLKKIKK